MNTHLDGISSLALEHVSERLAGGQYGEATTVMSENIVDRLIDRLETIAERFD